MSTVVGLGWSSQATAASALAVVKAVVAHYAVLHIDKIACPDWKNEKNIACFLAQELNVPLVWVSQHELACVQPACLTQSASVRAKTGLGSVAEACALIGAGPQARLYGPRRVLHNVTCALAQGV